MWSLYLHVIYVHNLSEILVIYNFKFTLISLPFYYFNFPINPGSQHLAFNQINLVSC